MPRHVELRRHFNARASTRDTERTRGGFNAWGNSFPFEELPFGDVVTVGGVPFRLEQAGDFDHLEADGQSIDLPDFPATRLALLAFGEMGSQHLATSIEGGSGAHQVMVEAPGWLIEGGLEGLNAASALCCTHLHYPGDYELALLRPAMWRCEVELPSCQSWSRLSLGRNPLFHVAAVTLVDSSDA